MWLGLGSFGFVTELAGGDSFAVDDVLGVWCATSIGGYSVPGTVAYEGVTHDAQYVRWGFYDGGQCTLTQRVDGATECCDPCDFTVNSAQTVSISLLSETWDGSLDADSITVTGPRDLVSVLRKQRVSRTGPHTCNES